ncbi:MAG: hypothetical protein L0387_07030 [Acidobacteria bacterium]|nr:hypothetical protein [Acidobacteriota bacterium]
MLTAHRISLRVSLIFPLLLFTLMSGLHAQTSASGSDPSQHDKPKNPALLARLREVSKFEQFAAYWTTEPGWHTELQMRNNLSNRDLTVTPVLRSFDGSEVALAAVTIQPGDTASVDLQEALRAAPEFSGKYGSVAFRYSATVNRALFASVMIGMPGTPIMFHLDASAAPAKWVQGSREGVWWLPRTTASADLILANTSDRNLEVKLSLYDSAGSAADQQIALGARQTNRLSLRTLLQNAGLQGAYGGVKLDVANGAAYLDSVHLVYDESSGYSGLMKMFDHDPRATLSERSWGKTKRTNEWITRAPMLALSNPDPALAFPPETRLEPKILVHNSTGKGYSANLTFHWRSDKTSGTSAPVSVALKPRETQMVDVAALQAQNVVPMEAHWAFIEISAPIQPEELIALASSYDKTGRYGAQTPFNDQLAYHWEGGKWQVDGTRNSLITAGNGGEKPVRARMTLLYNGGRDKYEIEQTLAPGEQMWIDVGKLIRNRVPDITGQTLPSDLNSGAYQFFEMDSNGIGNLFEGKLIVDKTYGHAAYGCMVCCGPARGLMVFDPLGLNVFFTGNQGVQGVDECTGSEVEMTGYYSTWWTGSTAIATANMSAITGQGIGSTTDTARGTFQWGAGQESRLCPTRTDTTSSGVDVDPTVAFNSARLYALIGSDSIVVSGNIQAAAGNPPGGAFSWTTADTNITFNNPSASLVRLTVSGPPGTANISMGYQVNGRSAAPATRTITKRLFRFLEQKGQVQIIHFTPAGSGYDARAFYNVLTNPNRQVLEPGNGGIPALETVTVVSTTVNGEPVDIPTDSFFGNGALSQNSEVEDNLSLRCRPSGSVCLPEGYERQDRQEIVVGNFFVRRNLIARTRSTVTILNEGPFE